MALRPATVSRSTRIENSNLVRLIFRTGIFLNAPKRLVTKDWLGPWDVSHPLGGWQYPDCRPAGL
jgi:hypothetical protein